MRYLWIGALVFMFTLFELSVVKSSVLHGGETATRRDDEKSIETMCFETMRTLVEQMQEHQRTIVERCTQAMDLCIKKFDG